MSDRMEAAITHLQIIHTWAEFARERGLQFFTPKHLEDIAQWSADALVMIKEQKQMYLTLEHDWRMLRNMATQNVVRCKDCKHGELLFADYVSCQISEENESGCHASHRPDWFCADGERKNDG